MPRTKQPAANRIGYVQSRASRDRAKIYNEDEWLGASQSKAQLKAKIAVRDRAALGDKKTR